MRAAVYTRVPQPTVGPSHDEQLSRGSVTCRDLGLQLVGHYADTGVSRGEVIRLLNDLRAGRFEVVVVDTLDRFPREVDAVERIALAGGRLADAGAEDLEVTPAQRWAAQARAMADAAEAEQRGELHLVL